MDSIVRNENHNLRIIIFYKQTNFMKACLEMLTDNYIYKRG